MKKFFALYAVAFLAVLMLVACGDEETVVETHTSTGYDLIPEGSFVSDYDCDESHLGRLLFSETFKSVYLCDGEAWQIINGKNGTNGRDGKVGTNGKDGKDGVDGKDGNVCTVTDRLDRLEFNCNGDTSTIVFDWKIDDGCAIVSATDSLITIVCDSSKIEVPNALDGKNGVDCSLEDKGDGTYRQVCGDSVFEFRQSLSRVDESEVVKFCGGHSYNAKVDTCIEETVYGHCGDTLFNRLVDFCTNGEVYATCGGGIYNYYNVKTQYCEDGVVLAYCGETSYDPSKNICRDGKLIGGE